MKCPHCDNELPGSPCQDCGATIPDGAKYCMDCGFSLEPKTEDPSVRASMDEDENGFDPEDRVLCPDGTCTGIILDGKCTECGKPSEE